MAGTTTLELQSLLDLALAEPIGLLLRSADPPKLRAKLYAVRKQNKDYALLQFRTSPFPEGDIVIVKGAEEAPRALPLLDDMKGFSL